MRNTIKVSDYYHIQSTVTYDYYGTDGTYLGQQSTTGLYNKPYSVNAPYNFGNYYIEGSTTQSGPYPKHDEILDVYYKYVPPIVYYNTSNPYATTYYANGYEYVPNYIPPVVYYVPTYDSYGYGGGYSYSGGYGYSSGGGYSNSNGTCHPNYVPQSAYYTKEAQLVAEERGDGGELPGGEDSDNWLEGELGSQSIGISGAIGWAKYGPELAGASDFAGGIGGGFLTAGVELATGHDANDAMAKGFANAGITLAVGTLITWGLLAVAAPALVAIGVGLVISSALSFGYDWLYDHRKGKK